MKKVSIILLSVVFLVGLVACGPADGDPVEATPEQTVPEEEGDGSTFPRPTITPESGSDTEGYPAPQPEVVNPSEGYPGVPVLEQVSNAYPAVAGMTWLVFPTGVQCEEGKVYENLDEAISALEEADVTVNDEGSISLNVIALCGAPSSQHYLAQVADADVAAAEALGWSIYEE